MHQTEGYRHSYIGSSVLLDLAAILFSVPSTLMKLLRSSLLLTVLVLGACNRTPVANPDPNHTHADFAVWIDGHQMDLSGPQFMSGTSDEADPNHTKHDPYLHLHDGNGHVIHRHKPGLTVADFFASLKLGFTDRCFSSGIPGEDGELCSEHPFRLFVNGTEQSFNALTYAFQDGDHILITTATEDAVIKEQLSLMTDDACLYSKTCPWRGEPPTENCIADPEVPCVE
jgi:hypothetical protein